MQQEHLDLTTATDADLLAWLRDLCRDAGLRATPQRIEILKEIAGHRGHPSAEDIYAAIVERMPTVSLDTVYRTLGLFEQHAVLVKLWGPGGRCRYDPNVAPHHHLVCDACGAIEDFAWPHFDRLTPPEDAAQWGTVSRVQVEVHGLCRDCATRD